MKRIREDESDNGKDKEEEEEEKKHKGKKGDKEFDLSVKRLKTKKDKIKQPYLAERDVIPRITSCCLFVGGTGSGKTTLLANLVTNKDMLNADKWYDETYLISPTGKTDDIQKHLDLDDDHILTDLEEAADILGDIMEEASEAIEEQGADKAPQRLIIFDDVVGNSELMSHPNFVKSFIACRHHNFTTMLCSQSWTAMPRKVRLQAQNIFLFPSSNSEMEKITEEYCPPGYDKKAFFALVKFATSDRYSFLHINKRVPFEVRYRKNLDEVIVLESYDEFADADGSDNKKDADQNSNPLNENDKHVDGPISERRSKKSEKGQSTGVGKS